MDVFFPDDILTGWKLRHQQITTELQFVGIYTLQQHFLLPDFYPL